jgi:hypothetical protein
VPFKFNLRRYSVGITTANVVRAPIQRSFALEENLAEVGVGTFHHVISNRCRRLQEREAVC